MLFNNYCKYMLQLGSQLQKWIMRKHIPAKFLFPLISTKVLKLHVHEDTRRLEAGHITSTGAQPDENVSGRGQILISLNYFKSESSQFWACVWRQANLAVGEKLEIFLLEIRAFKENFCYKNSTVFFQVMLCGKTTSNKQIWCIFCCLNTISKIEWSAGA